LAFGLTLREQHRHTILNAWFKPEKLELGNAFERSAARLAAQSFGEG
jgi:hypothetical protein